MNQYWHILQTCKFICICRCISRPICSAES